jgi:hypothetical protein
MASFNPVHKVLCNTAGVESHLKKWTGFSHLESIASTCQTSCILYACYRCKDEHDRFGDLPRKPIFINDDRIFVSVFFTSARLLRCSKSRMESTVAV